MSTPPPHHRRAAPFQAKAPCATERSTETLSVLESVESYQDRRMESTPRAAGRIAPGMTRKGPQGGFHSNDNLVVIGIIAILVAVAFPRLLEARRTAREI